MFGDDGGKERGDTKNHNRILRAVAVLVLACALVVALAVLSEPEPHHPFTEFYLLDQERVPAASPMDCSLSESQELVVGVHNHEFEDEAYVLEIFLIREQFDTAENVSRISSMDLLDRHALNLSHDEVREFTYTFGINSPQYNKIELLLHKDEVPPAEIRNEDRITASYRDLHIWIDIVP
jgi:uncharacterized membrane protein